MEIQQCLDSCGGWIPVAIAVWVPFAAITGAALEASSSPVAKAIGARLLSLTVDGRKLWKGAK